MCWLGHDVHLCRTGLLYSHKSNAWMSSRYEHAGVSEGLLTLLYAAELKGGRSAQPYAVDPLPHTGRWPATAQQVEGDGLNPFYGHAQANRTCGQMRTLHIIHPPDRD